MHDLSPEDTVVSRLRYWSVTSPDTLAFVYATPDGQRYAYSRKELFSLSCRSATWLRQRGVGRQDVVLCLVPTSPEQTFVSLGASVLGATTICASIQYHDGSDIVPLMNYGDVTALVVDQTDKQAISALETHVPNLTSGSVTTQAVPSLKTVIFCDRSFQTPELSFLELISCEEEAEVVDVSPDDVATILVTSGTSGKSKLVSKTHRQVVSDGMQAQTVCTLEEGDVYYNPCSFAWISGYPSSYCVSGHTRVVPYIKGPQPEDEEKFLWDLWRREKVTHVVSSPLRLSRLAARKDLLHSDVTWRARVVVFGGGAVKKEFSCVLGTLTRKLVVFYGCTETAIMSFKAYTEKDTEVEDFNCGRPVEGVQVKIVDEHLQEVPPNTKGDILIKRDGYFHGYLKQPGLTAEAEPEEGWFRPDDYGYINDKGEIFVEGRRTEVIAIGSFKIYPQLLESHLMKCPGVHDVAVIPIPDSDFDNRPCVCVVQDPRPEAKRVVPDDVLRTCAEYFQESFLRVDKQRETAVPKVCLVFDKFPLNPNGKVQRKVLRSLALERLGMWNDEI